MEQQIVHATTGRVRFRVPRVQRDPAYGELLVQLLESLAIVEQVRLNRQAATVVVQYQPHLLDEAAVYERLNQCFEQAMVAMPQPFPDSAAPADAIALEDYQAQVEADARLETDWERLGLPLVALGLSLLSGPLELPLAVVGTTVLASAWPWFQRVGHQISQGHPPNVDLLDSLWMVLHTINGQFLAPALKTTLAGARADVRDRQRRQQLHRYPSVLMAHCEYLTVERQGHSLTIERQELQAADLLWLRPGDLVPADGVVVAGLAEVEPAHFEASREVWVCRPGDALYAGSQILTGQVQLWVIRSGWQTRLGLITHLLHTEPVYDSALAHQQGEFARHAVLPTLALSGALWLGTTGVYGPAIAPLQLDFGSGVQLSLRTVMLSAQVFAVQQGVYLPTAGTLEQLAQLESLVIDARAGLPQPQQAQILIQQLRQLGLHIYLLQDQGRPLGGTTEVTRDRLPDLQAYLVSQRRRVGWISFGETCSCPEPTWLPIRWQPPTFDPNAKGVVLLEGDWSALGRGIAIARDALERTYQNVALIALPNLAVTFGGMFFGLHPVVNVVTNNATAFIAEFWHGNSTQFRTALLPRVSTTLPLQPLPLEFPQLAVAS
ncbi:HMA2 domain-containing protein [Thermosynechococcus vestitus]|uniref:Tlr0816 protein n=1 Tax=Thermosynechococcus vestitus (strain NIES-2133 / IAM M-273 / BP-1) TaxID=197221 RepID=Q8DKP3_THEVB|nr:cation-transporting ATPase [Thermosynechococcus vestitus]BAC08367.1 tlr0816 [Thermosynechococcus vestitus BP-1]